MYHSHRGQSSQFEDFSQQTSDFIPQSRLIMISGFFFWQRILGEILQSYGQSLKARMCQVQILYPNLFLSANLSCSQNLDPSMMTFAKGVPEEDPRAVTTYWTWWFVVPRGKESQMPGALLLSMLFQPPRMAFQIHKDLFLLNHPTGLTSGLSQELTFCTYCSPN